MKDEKLRFEFGIGALCWWIAWLFTPGWAGWYLAAAILTTGAWLAMVFRQASREVDEMTKDVDR